VCEIMIIHYRAYGGGHGAAIRLYIMIRSLPFYSFVSRSIHSSYLLFILTVAYGLGFWYVAVRHVLFSVPYNMLPSHFAYIIDSSSLLRDSI